MTRKQKLVLVTVAVLVATVVGVGVGAFFAVKSAAGALFQSAETEWSNMAVHLSDRELKCAVAQLELHRLRYGHYPQTLQDLRFLSQLDQSIVVNVAYFPNRELTGYYVEIRNGLNGLSSAPKLEYPDEFWQGTGFRKDLKPTG